MITHNLGYPRIGNQRELKKASEQYWSGQTTKEELLRTGRDVRSHNRQLHQEAGINGIPSNDFSYYDQVLDMVMMTGAFPDRFRPMEQDSGLDELDLYFAMARGRQDDRYDAVPMEMTKWFDTNYHYIVPEFKKDQQFKLNSEKVLGEFKEALEAGLRTKPVIIGPVSFLMLGKETDNSFDKLDLLPGLLPVYEELLSKLEKAGAEWVQIDEPFLGFDLDEKTRSSFRRAWSNFEGFKSLKLLLTTYFESPLINRDIIFDTPADAFHVDITRIRNGEIDTLLNELPENMSLSAGIVDGRNIWKNDYQASLKVITKLRQKLGSERLMIAPSCSLLHVPCDLELERDNPNVDAELLGWLAFARQKLDEVVTLGILTEKEPSEEARHEQEANTGAIETRLTSERIHRAAVGERMEKISDQDAERGNPFAIRKEKQKQELGLPLLPTTTIGSFPQTKEVRRKRAEHRRGELSTADYESFLKEETQSGIQKQEEIGLDVLVHGEFERNDMVEYFGEKLNGFAFTRYGWVQSYGSRCVKPPIIYGDVERPEPMTVDWIRYAQSLTGRPVKGMLTGPVTILKWSFVRDDQPHEATANQIALAIRDEVKDLEEEGIRVIQIDEPAFREGLPLRKSKWAEYLDWAVKAFRLASSGVRDETQIHTHMCYAEFGDTIQSIADMDADVISIETSRSHMELLNVFADFEYPNDIGPGVYDIHSPRVPSEQDIRVLITRALEVLPADKLWINPDCGLKTRTWEEITPALRNMVQAAQSFREEQEPA